jgi:nucleoside phosphorylase
MYVDANFYTTKLKKYTVAVGKEFVESTNYIMVSKIREAAKSIGIHLPNVTEESFCNEVKKSLQITESINRLFEDGNNSREREIEQLNLQIEYLTNHLKGINTSEVASNPCETNNQKPVESDKNEHYIVQEGSDFTPAEQSTQQPEIAGQAVVNYGTAIVGRDIVAGDFDNSKNKFGSTTTTRQNNPVLPNAIDEKKEEKRIPFLFITVNENEKAAFDNVFNKQGKPNYVDAAPYYCGTFGQYPAAWFHVPKQGQKRPDATILCGKVIKEVNPYAVVSVGIAFGANKNKQKIGDVLVAEYILDYESKKVRKEFTKYTESAKETGYQLGNAFIASSLEWKYPSGANENERYKVIPGAMLTGSILYDNFKEKKKLLEEFAEHEPIGGEMEAYGIYSQCRSLGISEWIIVKAICDWGYNKGNAKKEEWQKNAAASAIDLCRSVFSLIGQNGKGIFNDLIKQ